MKGPPEATLARRAKSYSDFYDVAVDYLQADAKEKPIDAFDLFKRAENDSSSTSNYGDFESELLDASSDEYQ